MLESQLLSQVLRVLLIILKDIICVVGTNVAHFELNHLISLLRAPTAPTSNKISHLILTAAKVAPLVYDNAWIIILARSHIEADVFTIVLACISDWVHYGFSALILLLRAVLACCAAVLGRAPLPREPLLVLPAVDYALPDYACEAGQRNDNTGDTERHLEFWIQSNHERPLRYEQGLDGGVVVAANAHRNVVHML